MAVLHLTNDQLKLVQGALDFYARVGIGQMNVITEHPTFQKTLYDKLKPNKDFEIGDKTNRGEIIEIGNDFIKTKNIKNKEEKIETWSDIDNIKFSIDYSIFHQIMDDSLKLLNKGRNLLLKEDLLSKGGYGIYNPSVDESCRVAYDIIQVIRNEFWKNEENKVENSIDSSVHLTTKNSENIKCEIDINE